MWPPRGWRGGKCGYTRGVDISHLVKSANPLIERALEEDIGPGDRTSEAIVPPDVTGTCSIVAKAEGFACGLPLAEAVFQRVVPQATFTHHFQDGEPVEPGDRLAEVHGPIRGLLTAERTALNFLAKLSGIATLAACYVDAVANYGAVILDTRKTTPGWRALEKYAVRCGGARNHRMGLYDMVLIKDNHIAAAGGLSAAVRRAQEADAELPIEVEVSSLAALEEALGLRLDRVLLDNMDIATLRKAVGIAGGQVFLEASGGISLARAEEIAASGVDAISVGALTHSAPALDVSLELNT